MKGDAYNGFGDREPGQSKNIEGKAICKALAGESHGYLSSKISRSTGRAGWGCGCLASCSWSLGGSQHTVLSS